MRHAAAMIILLCLAGCTADRGLSGKPGHATADASASQKAPVDGLKPGSTLAALPDRGELLAYPRGRRLPPAVGAYTSYPVDLSEAHAIGAIATGELRVTAPDGRLLRLRYERHVEHPDGNWTWVGRLNGAENQEAVLTFGAHAVYGSIPQGDDRLPLQVTMSGGQALIVAADPRRLLNGHTAKRPLKPDYFVPPRAIQEAAVIAPTGTAGDGGAKAITTVDVLIGYTPGFASAGDSAARTRLNNLIEVGNQALVNSQVEVRLRLVQSMPVTYPDATDNGDALEQLTGFRAPSTRVPPAQQFAALRAAREQFGADLVVLVRKFERPENNGCGIAWLIGGGQSGIGAGSDYFGYSVVSDGSEFDPGSGLTYFCRDETLVHELGHNLGSQHDVATARGPDGVLDADEYGRFPYSFGYKSPPSGASFYTVMAYGDQGQIANRVFSNPRVRICGPSFALFACGVENQADNARSLAQTAPIIASFRAAVTPPPAPGNRAHNDMNYDGRSDLLWTSPDARGGDLVTWFMNGPSITRTSFDWYSPSNPSQGPLELIGTGDLDGNNVTDLVFLDRETGEVFVRLYQSWGSYNFNFYRLPIYVLGNSWTLAGTGDVNGDGKDDLLWSRPATGQFVYWLMNGNVLSGSAAFTVPSTHKAIGVGDLDGNGRVDIVWHDANGAVRVWLGQANGTYVDQFVYTLATSWKLIASDDANNDGKDDLLWSRPASALFVHWLMNGSTLVSSAGYPVNSGWTAIGRGDFDGNGRADVVWINGAGNIHFWSGQPSGYASQFVYTLTGWTLFP